MNTTQQEIFDLSIGRLDRDLSVLVNYAKHHLEKQLDEANLQTLKHHAEDMILAGKKILKELGIVEKPQ